MDAFEMGRIAVKHDTAMAHAMLHAVAVAVMMMSGWHKT